MIFCRCEKGFSKRRLTSYNDDHRRHLQYYVSSWQTGNNKWVLLHSYYSHYLVWLHWIVYYTMAIFLLLPLVEYMLSVIVSSILRRQRQEKCKKWLNRKKHQRRRSFLSRCFFACFHVFSITIGMNQATSKNMSSIVKYLHVLYAGLYNRCHVAFLPPVEHGWWLCDSKLLA